MRRSASDHGLRSPVRILLTYVLLVTAPSCGGGSAAPSSVPQPVGTPVGTPIGAAGGTVTGLGSAATLVVPPNALATTVSLTLGAPTEAPLDPSAVTGAAVQLGPTAAFSAPATLTLRYDPALRPSGSDESELSLHVLTGGAWQPFGGGRVDVATHTVAAAINATGTYGVRWPDPTAPCASRESAQFDFWLGAWSFAATGSAPGTNDIAKEGAGCLIQERFRDTLGTQGRSVSFVSRLDGRWHQTYIDSQGGRLVLVGQFEDGQMRLYATPTQRFNWLPQGPDRIRYFEERSADSGVSWSTRFDSTYTRR